MAQVFVLPYVGDYSNINAMTVQTVPEQYVPLINALETTNSLIISGQLGVNSENYGYGRRGTNKSDSICYAFYIENNVIRFSVGVRETAIQYVCSQHTAPDTKTYLQGSGLNGPYAAISSSGIFPIDSFALGQDMLFADATSALNAATEWAFPPVMYPITYHYANSTVAGPTEAAVGDIVTVSAVPDVGYGITDASSQILVTNDDDPVSYTWDAQSNLITFTMPQPATNRGGFGSTGH